MKKIVFISLIAIAATATTLLVVGVLLFTAFVGALKYSFRVPPEYVPLTSLEADEINMVVPPDTKQLYRYGRKQEGTIDGPIAAYVVTYYGTSLSKQDVARFYSKKLQSLGWYEWLERAWCKNWMDFEVKFADDHSQVKEEITHLKLSSAEYPVLYSTQLTGMTGVKECKIPPK